MTKVGESFLMKRTKEELGVATPKNPNFPWNAKAAHWEHMGNYPEALRFTPGKKSSGK